MDVTWESDAQFDPLMDHLLYTKNPRLAPWYTFSAHSQPNVIHQQSIHNAPWMIPRRPYHPVRASTYPERSIPRLRDIPRSAVAQRILKEQAAASRQKSLKENESLITPIENPDSGNVDEESFSVSQTSPREQLNQPQVSPKVGSRCSFIYLLSFPATVSTLKPLPTLADQELLAQELCRLMPTLDDLSVQPVNSYSTVCDKATVMVQRVHDFTRKIHLSLGGAALGTPFASPDRLTAAILGLNWRAVKRAVEKTPEVAGPLPPCRTPLRPPERRVAKATKHKRGEISSDTRIAIVKDYIVHRHTQSVCATKYEVKLSYVQYVVKRFRQTGILHLGDFVVDQSELPREPNGSIRENALIRRLNDIPDPPIMKEKEKEIEIEEYEDTLKVRRGRKRKFNSSGEMEDESQRSSLSVWSDIDDEGEEKNDSLSTKGDTGEGMLDDYSMDTETSETADESIIVTNSIDPEGEDVNILDTSYDE